VSAFTHHTQEIEVLLSPQALVNGITGTWHAAGTQTTRAPLFSDCYVFLTCNIFRIRKAINILRKSNKQLLWETSFLI
jgi:hypothetical protein